MGGKVQQANLYTRRHLDVRIVSLAFGPLTSIEPPGLAPGLFLLGPVPAIIRCWLNTDFKHDALLYAAICSGTYMSCLDCKIVEHLGFQDQVVVDNKGTRKIKLPVYLPEAVPVSASSRSNSPAPHLPSIIVDFTIIEEYHADANVKAIQIFLGSDTLREHHADIMFSSNQLMLYDDDRSKLQIPLVRPEDERAFNALSVTCRPRTLGQPQSKSDSVPILLSQNVISQSSTVSHESPLPATILDIDGNVAESDKSDLSYLPSLGQHPHLGLTAVSCADTDTKGARDGNITSESQQSGATSATSATWSNWRGESSEKATASPLDWANIGRSIGSSVSSERRDVGIKVLKPSKPSRSMQTSTSSAGGGQSRFFDDGKQRSEIEVSAGPAVNASKKTGAVKDGAPAVGKQRGCQSGGWCVCLCVAEQW